MVDKALISQRTLKYIAYISMVMDHLGIMLNRHELISGEVYAIMRGVGRLAFPLFLFCWFREQSIPSPLPNIWGAWHYSPLSPRFLMIFSRVMSFLVCAVKTFTLNFLHALS